MEFKISGKVLDLPVEALDLSERSKNCLKRYKFNTVDDILTRKNEFLKMKGAGVKTIKEIKNKILEAQILYVCGELN